MKNYRKLVIALHLVALVVVGVVSEDKYFSWDGEYYIWDKQKPDWEWVKHNLPTSSKQLYWIKNLPSGLTINSVTPYYGWDTLLYKGNQYYNWNEFDWNGQQGKWRWIESTLTPQLVLPEVSVSYATNIVIHSSSTEQLYWQSGNPDLLTISIPEPVEAPDIEILGPFYILMTNCNITRDRITFPDGAKIYLED